MLGRTQSVTVHRVRRPQPATTRHASTQASPVAQLKQEIRAAGTGRDTLPKLHQLRRSPLYETVWQAGSTPGNMAANDTQAARNHERLKAEAFTTCHALDAILKLSDAYQFRLTTRSQETISERDFFEQITPAHAKRLIGDFQQTWAKNDETRQAAIVSALSAESVARLDLSPSAAHRDLGTSWGAIPARQQLATSELLALVDYVNSRTGIFNAVNGAAMAAAYYGDRTLSGLMTVYSSALNGAVAKLCAHPYFGRTDIVTYKGVNLRNPSGRFRLDALEQAIGTGKLIAFPNVLSTTADPEQSYAAQKYFDGYTIECRIRMPKAFYADPFHDVMTMGEQEVIGPAGQRFVVTEKQTVAMFQWASGRDEEVDRYHLEPAAGRPR